MSLLLYALQVYDEEIERAIKTAVIHEVMCAGRRHENVDCLLVYRRDCPESPALVANLEKSFRSVMTYRTMRREIGHPAGPNGMWCDLMQHIMQCARRGMLKHECILTTEVDALPLAQDWPDKLLQAWRAARKPVCGCWCKGDDHGGKTGHINGNALFDLRLASLDPRLTGCPAHLAWDTYFAPIFHSLGWADIPEIRNLYRSENLKPKQFQKLKESGCVWLHGVRDDSLANLLLKQS